MIAALQVNARASFGTIAAALGEQERTVARRAERLLELGLLRLTAFVDELRTGLGQPVSLRITVEPGALDAVAEKLCTRPDTRAVMAVTGDADVCCELVAADRPTLHRVLAHELPSIDGIRRTRTYVVLRHVKPTSEWRLPRLTNRQVSRLRSKTPAPRQDGTVELSATDLELIEQLRTNARISYTDLGDRLGVTSTTARRRIDRLLQSGAVSLRASVEPALLGLPVEADVWLDVSPDAVEHVAHRLAARPEVTYCGVVAGGYALELILALPDLHHLYAFSTDVIGVEPAVRRSEPTLVTHTYKRGYRLTSPSA